MIKGNHIVVDFVASSDEKLFWSQDLEDFIVRSIISNGFHILGTISHKFENGSYSIVIALAESHFSIHTWPENKLVAMDLFVSDFLKENEETVNRFINQLKDYYQPISWNQKDVPRFEKSLFI